MRRVKIDPDRGPQWNDGDVLMWDSNAEEWMPSNELVLRNMIDVIEEEKENDRR